MGDAFDRGEIAATAVARKGRHARFRFDFLEDDKALKDELSGGAR